MKKITDKDYLKSHLIIASLYLSSYEILRTSIVDRIKGFFSNSPQFIDGKIVHEESEDYKKEILDRDIPNANKSNKDYFIFCASLDWLKYMNLITDEDIEEIHNIRRHRNIVAHEMVEYVVDDSKLIDITYFKKMQEYITKIEKMWASFELSVNPDFIGKEIDEKEVSSGLITLTDHLMTIVGEEFLKIVEKLEKKEG